MNKLSILLQAIIGNLYKVKVWFYLLLNIKPKCSNQIAKNVIISLTSYDRRVSKCAPYTVFSMIVQTMRPERIVLWIDNEKWNYQNLPFALRRMKQWGMFEIQFCKDIRSFTKLIPALKCYSDKVIVTVDDDLYYSSKMLEELYNRYTNNPNKICALKFRIPTFDIEGNLCTYSKWKEYHEVSHRSLFDENLLFPLGFGGVLYPPDSFDEAIFNESVFMDLCPLADDIWFYVMAIKNETLRTWVPESKVRYYFVDLLYQVVKKDRLYDENVGLDKNDSQLVSVLKYYKLVLFK